MDNISIEINNTTCFPRTEEPVAVGIPIPKGEIQDVSSLILKDEKGKIAAQFTPTNLWPDSSLKWVLLHFQPSVAANSIRNYSLEKTSTDQKYEAEGLTINEHEDSFLVNTGVTTFILDKCSFLPFSTVKCNASEMLSPRLSKIILTDKDDTEIPAEISTIAVESAGYLKTTIKAEGSFKKQGSEVLDFIARLHFFKNNSFVKIDFTLWNQNPAKHTGGLWDLGDPGSVLFKELALKLALSDEVGKEINIRAELGEAIEKIRAQDVRIYQDSSGGKNWKSTNHINRDMNIPVSFKGYKVYSEDGIIREGLRATPIVYVGDGENGVSVTVKNFWQNFPKAISVKPNEITISLYPEEFADLHELQGGERKTHSIFLDFGGVPDALAFVDQPLLCTLSREWYAQTDTVPYLCRSAVEDDQPYDDLLKSVVSGETSFFAKREIIDQYGWRNFGEIYADHEAVGYDVKMPLISHYNNQYDPIYGFFREYIASGNGAWFELMDELAHHVADIDIYHTSNDRREYNNGLHWHTNHYLDAGTCSHRSMSKCHLDKHDPKFYGGGPGMEHCYASGFLYHYFITGEEASREALLTLADWVCNCTSDPDTIFGLLYRVKSMLPLWKKVLVGNKIRADRFAFTRGSGNPLSVLLDAYTLSSDRIYLTKAEEIVRGCIHPYDDIESRNLLNAEIAWSYNVCLQAIGKYLDIKISINEFDYMYSYAQESLLHYATWMVRHEYPYLEKTEILEFPNETWVAQDLRKSCIFYFASKHSSDELKGQFLEKADYYHNYVIDKLNEFKTRFLARPVALITQNRWMHAYFNEDPDAMAPKSPDKYDFSRQNEFWSKNEIVKTIYKNLLYTCKGFSFAKERHWLRCRKGKHVRS